MYKSFCAVGACFWVSPAGCQCNGFKMRQRPPYWSQCLQAAVLSVVRRVRIKVGKGEQKTEDGSCELSNICLSWQDSFFFFFFSWVFALSSGESRLLSHPYDSPRFLYAVLRSPGTFSPCYLALSWKRYPFCHHAPLGECHGGIPSPLKAQPRGGMWPLPPPRPCRELEKGGDGS